MASVGVSKSKREIKPSLRLMAPQLEKPSDPNPQKLKEFTSLCESLTREQLYGIL